MKFKHLSRIAMTLTACSVIACTDRRQEISYSPHVDWGVDEYEFFDLTKAAVEKKFDGVLCFKHGFQRLHLIDGPHLNYLGPTFRIGFTDGKVTSVQGVFEGCKETLFRPPFSNKKDALKFAIEGLSSANASDTRTLNKLAAARRELAAVEASQ